MKTRLLLATAALALVSACGSPEPTTPDLAPGGPRLDSGHLGGGFRDGDTLQVVQSTTTRDSTVIVTDGPYIGGGL